MKYGAVKAFTTIELLIALMITIVLIAPLNMLLNSLHYLNYDLLTAMEDEISLQQLRLYLVNGEDFSIENGCLYYVKSLEQKQLCLVNQKLISQPGTLIFHSNVNEINFSNDANTLYLSYCRKNVCYEKWIAFN